MVKEEVKAEVEVKEEEKEEEETLKTKEEEEKPEYEVEILAREEITTFPKLRQPVVNIIVTYAAAGLPPASITIPKDKYSKELEAKLIREDIQRRLAFKPEIIKV